MIQTPLNIAQQYSARGWTSVPVPVKTKRPVLPGWQKLHFENGDVARLFGEAPQNVSVLLGPASGGLTDLDLDCMEAVRCAPLILPATASIFGRASKRASHYLYVTDLSTSQKKAFIKFEDPTDGKTLVEIRVGGEKGAHTVFPGSVHESGEAVEWANNGEPEPVGDRELLKAGSKLAAVSLLARHWGGRGGRNEHRMILHGFLLRNGISVDDTATFVDAVTIGAGGQAEPDQRISEAQTTKDKLASGGNVPGFPSLAEAFGEPIAKKVAEWLGFSFQISTVPNSQIRTGGAISARDLQSMEFADIKYVVPGYITEGATILAGRPKIGKSWMALAIAIAVGSGGKIFGSVDCEQGDVLYLALEDNQRRLQRRMRKIMPFQPWPERLELRTTARGLKEGGVEDIETWLDAHSEARLVIIDTLAKVRGSQKENDSAYRADYAALEEIQRVAIDRGVAVLLIHHVRKMEADDPIDTVSGTTGLTGVVDTILVLRRDTDGLVTLYGRGRDIEEIETVVEFEPGNCAWRLIGDADEFRQSDERKAILQVLKDAKGSMSPKAIAEEADMSGDVVRQLLAKLCKAGKTKKEGRGQYVLCEDAIA